MNAPGLFVLNESRRIFGFEVVLNELLVCVFFCSDLFVPVWFGWSAVCRIVLFVFDSIAEAFSRP